MWKQDVVMGYDISTGKWATLPPYVQSKELCNDSHQQPTSASGWCQGLPLGPDHITIYGHKTVGMWTNEILIHAEQSVLDSQFFRVSFVRHEIISLL